MNKKLNKSQNVKIAGVCGGIAEYLDIDPTIIRVCWILLTVFCCPCTGIFLYILLSILMD